MSSIKSKMNGAAQTSATNFKNLDYNMSTLDVENSIVLKDAVKEHMAYQNQLIEEIDNAKDSPIN